MMNIVPIKNGVSIWSRIAVVLSIFFACKGICLADGNNSFRVGLRAPMFTVNLIGKGSEPTNSGAERPLSDDTARPESGRPNSLGYSVSDSEEEISEAAIKALDFFARKQKPQGYWSETSSPIAHTGLVVLSYLSYGVTHKSVMHKGTEPYMENVESALGWLVAQVGPDGALRDGGRMYDQAAGTYALAEAYMVTKDERLKEPLQRAANWLVDSQHEAGGWRYNRNMPGDLSVSGWVISALVSAGNAGAIVPDEVFKKAGAFVLAQHSSDGKYGYQGKGSVSLTMSAAGMFCLQLLGQEIMGPIVGGSGFNGGGGGGQENNNALYKELIGKSSGTLMQNLPEDALGTGRPFYYWYYGTFAIRILGGESWAKWKSNMHNTLLPTQVNDGTDNDGSWNPRQADTGRIVTTAWAVLTMMAPERPVLTPTDPRRPSWNPSLSLRSWQEVVRQLKREKP